MSSPRGYGRKFLAISLSISLLPLPPASLVRSAFADDETPPEKPIQVAQAVNIQPGATPPPASSQPPPPPEEQTGAEAAAALSRLTKPLLDAALASDAVKAMTEAYSAAAKTLADLFEKAKASGAEVPAELKEAEKRAEVVKPLVDAKEAAAAARALASELEPKLATPSASLDAKAWEGFDKGLAGLSSRAAKLREVIAAERRRAEEYFGAGEKGTELRKLHASVLETLEGERQALEARLVPIREYALSRPGSVTGDAAGKLLEDIQAQAPAAFKTATPADLNRLRTRLAGLALADADPARVNAEFRSFFERAGLDAASSKAAFSALSAAAQTQSDSVRRQAARVAFTDPAQVPARPGEGPALAVPAPVESSPAKTPLQAPDWVRSATAKMRESGLGAIDALKAFMPEGTSPEELARWAASLSILPPVVPGASLDALAAGTARLSAGAKEETVRLAAAEREQRRATVSSQVSGLSAELRAITARIPSAGGDPKTAEAWRTSLGALQAKLSGDSNPFSSAEAEIKALKAAGLDPAAVAELEKALAEAKPLVEFVRGLASIPELDLTQLKDGTREQFVKDGRLGALGTAVQSQGRGPSEEDRRRVGAVREKLSSLQGLFSSTPTEGLKDALDKFFSGNAEFKGGEIEAAYTAWAAAAADPAKKADADRLRGILTRAVERAGDIAALDGTSADRAEAVMRGGFRDLNDSLYRHLRGSNPAPDSPAARFLAEYEARVAGSGSNLDQETDLAQLAKKALNSLPERALWLSMTKTQGEFQQAMAALDPAEDARLREQDTEAGRRIARLQRERDAMLAGSRPIALSDAHRATTLVPVASLSDPRYKGAADALAQSGLVPVDRDLLALLAAKHPKALEDMSWMGTLNGTLTSNRGVSRMESGGKTLLPMRGSDGSVTLYDPRGGFVRVAAKEMAALAKDDPKLFERLTKTLPPAQAASLRGESVPIILPFAYEGGFAEGGSREARVAVVMGDDGQMRIVAMPKSEPQAGGDLRTSLLAAMPRTLSEPRIRIDDRRRDGEAPLPVVTLDMLRKLGVSLPEGSQDLPVLRPSGSRQLIGSDQRRPLLTLAGGDRQGVVVDPRVLALLMDPRAGSGPELVRTQGAWTAATPDLLGRRPALRDSVADRRLPLLFGDRTGAFPLAAAADPLSRNLFQFPLGRSDPLALFAPTLQADPLAGLGVSAVSLVRSPKEVPDLEQRRLSYDREIEAVELQRREVKAELARREEARKALKEKGVDPDFLRREQRNNALTRVLTIAYENGLKDEGRQVEWRQARAAVVEELTGASASENGDGPSVIPNEVTALRRDAARLAGPDAPAPGSPEEDALVDSLSARLADFRNSGLLTEGFAQSLSTILQKRQREGEGKLSAEEKEFLQIWSGGDRSYLSTLRRTQAQYDEALGKALPDLEADERLSRFLATRDPRALTGPGGDEDAAVRAAFARMGLPGDAARDWRAVLERASSDAKFKEYASSLASSVSQRRAWADGARTSRDSIAGLFSSLDDPASSTDLQSRILAGLKGGGYRVMDRAWLEEAARKDRGALARDLSTAADSQADMRLDQIVFNMQDESRKRLAAAFTGETGRRLAGSKSELVASLPGLFAAQEKAYDDWMKWSRDPANKDAVRSFTAVQGSEAALMSLQSQAMLKPQDLKEGREIYLWQREADRNNAWFSRQKATLGAQQDGLGVGSTPANTKADGLLVRDDDAGTARFGARRDDGIDVIQNTEGARTRLNGMGKTEFEVYRSGGTEVYRLGAGYFVTAADGTPVPWKGDRATLKRVYDFVEMSRDARGNPYASPEVKVFARYEGRPGVNASGSLRLARETMSLLSQTLYLDGGVVETLDRDMMFKQRVAADGATTRWFLDPKAAAPALDATRRRETGRTIGRVFFGEYKEYLREVLDGDGKGTGKFESVSDINRGSMVWESRTLAAHSGTPGPEGSRTLSTEQAGSLKEPPRGSILRTDGYYLDTKFLPGSEHKQEREAMIRAAAERLNALALGRRGPDGLDAATQFLSRSLDMRLKDPLGKPMSDRTHSVSVWVTPIRYRTEKEGGTETPTMTATFSARGSDRPEDRFRYIGKFVGQAAADKPVLGTAAATGDKRIDPKLATGNEFKMAERIAAALNDNLGKREGLLVALEHNGFADVVGVMTGRNDLAEVRKTDSFDGRRRNLTWEDPGWNPMTWFPEVNFNNYKGYGRKLVLADGTEIALPDRYTYEGNWTKTTGLAVEDASRWTYNNIPGAKQYVDAYAWLYSQVTKPVFGFEVTPEHFFKIAGGLTTGAVRFAPELITVMLPFGAALKAVKWGLTAIEMARTARVVVTTAEVVFMALMVPGILDAVEKTGHAFKTGKAEDFADAAEEVTYNAAMLFAAPKIFKAVDANFHFGRGKTAGPRGMEAPAEFKGKLEGFAERKGDASPKDIGTPRDTAPRDTAPRDTAPRDTAPRDTAPRDTAPRDTAPRDTAPRDTAPRDTAPRDTAPRDSAPRDSAPADPGPRDFSPRDSAPQPAPQGPSGRGADLGGRSAPSSGPGFAERGSTLSSGGAEAAVGNLKASGGVTMTPQGPGAAPLSAAPAVRVEPPAGKAAGPAPGAAPAGAKPPAPAPFDPGAQKAPGAQTAGRQPAARPVEAAPREASAPRTVEARGEAPSTQPQAAAALLGPELASARMAPPELSSPKALADAALARQARAPAAEPQAAARKAPPIEPSASAAPPEFRAPRSDPASRAPKEAVPVERGAARDGASARVEPAARAPREAAPAAEPGLSEPSASARPSEAPGRGPRAEAPAALEVRPAERLPAESSPASAPEGARIPEAPVKKGWVSRLTESIDRSAEAQGERFGQTRTGKAFRAVDSVLSLPGRLVGVPLTGLGSAFGMAARAFAKDPTRPAGAPGQGFLAKTFGFMEGTLGHFGAQFNGHVEKPATLPYSAEVKTALKEALGEPGKAGMLAKLETARLYSSIDPVTGERSPLTARRPEGAASVLVIDLTVDHARGWAKVERFDFAGRDPGPLARERAARDLFSSVSAVPEGRAKPDTRTVEEIAAAERTARAERDAKLREHQNAYDSAAREWADRLDSARKAGPDTYASELAQARDALSPLARNLYQSGGTPEAAAVKSLRLQLSRAEKAGDQAAAASLREKLAFADAEAHVLGLSEFDGRARARLVAEAARDNARDAGLDPDALAARAQLRASLKGLEDSRAAARSVATALETAERAASALPKEHASRPSADAVVESLRLDLNRAQAAVSEAAAKAARAEASARARREAGAKLDVEAERYLYASPESVSALPEGLRARVQGLRAAERLIEAERKLLEGEAGLREGLEARAFLKQTDALLREYGVDAKLLDALHTEKARVLEALSKADADARKAASLVSEAERAGTTGDRLEALRSAHEAALAAREQAHTARGAFERRAIERLDPREAGLAADMLALGEQRAQARTAVSKAAVELRGLRSERATARAKALAAGLEPSRLAAEAAWRADASAAQRLQAAAVKTAVYRRRGFTAAQADAAASAAYRAARAEAGLGEAAPAEARVAYQGDGQMTCALHSFANQMKLPFERVEGVLREALGEGFLEKARSFGLSPAEMRQVGKLAAERLGREYKTVAHDEIFSTLAKGQDVVVVINFRPGERGTGGGPHAVNLKGGSLQVGPDGVARLSMMDSLVGGAGKPVTVAVADLVPLLTRHGGIVLGEGRPSAAALARYAADAAPLVRRYAGRPPELARGAEVRGREVGAANARETWVAERERLVADLARRRGVDPALVAKAVDAANRELGLNAGLFDGHPDMVSKHFERLGELPELVQKVDRLPRSAVPEGPRAAAAEAGAPRSPPDASHPVGALAALDAALSRPGAAERAASDPEFFRKAAQALLARSDAWRRSPEAPAARAGEGTAGIVAQQKAYSDALLSAARDWVKSRGLEEGKVISNGTTLDALLGITLQGRIEATNPHRGMSGESAEVWGAYGLEGGASYGAKRAVARGEPGVLLIIENARNPIRVVGGETLSRAPEAARDIVAAVVTDGRRTTVIQGDTLRALAGSAESWRGAVNAAARRGSMAEFGAYERLGARLSAQRVSGADAGGRSALEIGAAENPRLSRYFELSEFRRLHPREEGVYHDWRHSSNVADMAGAFGRSRGLPEAEARFLYETALLHDFDPMRSPGAPARVPATIEALRADFSGKVSLEGVPGRSVLRERFGWDARRLAMAEAMIQRTEFPFAETHPNPFYKDSGPLARYEAMLRELSPADRAFVLREGALLSEYADKSSWYATEAFDGAYRVVEGLANEINTASGGKAQMTTAKLDTASFLKVIGEPDSFALDRSLARKLGMEAPDLPARAQAFQLMGGDSAARFEANVRGFEAFGLSLKEGMAHQEALARGRAVAETSFESFRAREQGAGEVGAADAPALRAREATERLLDAVKRARTARPELVPEGSMLHATSEASLRRMLAAGKILPSVGPRDALYGDAVYAELFSARGADAVIGGPFYSLRTYGRMSAVEAARAGSADYRPVLLRIKGEQVRNPGKSSSYIDGAPIEGSAPLTKAEVRTLWERLPPSERPASFEAFSSRFKTAPEGLLGRLFGKADTGRSKVGAVPLEHVEVFDGASGKWVSARQYRFGAETAGRGPREAGPAEVGGAREVLRWPLDAALRLKSELVGDPGSRLYLRRTFGAPFNPSAEGIIRRAVRAAINEPGSVVGVLSADRIDTQTHSDCSIRANYNHPALEPVRRVLPYADFLRLNEALTGSRLRDTGTYHFQKGHILQALGYELGSEWKPTSSGDLARILREDGAVFGSVYFEMPRLLSPMDRGFAHAVVINGGIHETGWGSVLSAARERGLARTAWTMVKEGPWSTLKSLRDEGVWRFVMTDSNFSKPQLYTFKDLQGMNLVTSTLQSAVKRVPGGFARLTPAEHMQRAGDLQRRLSAVELPPGGGQASGLLARLRIGKQRPLATDSTVSVRADRKAVLEVEGWVKSVKRLDILPLEEARLRHPELVKRLREGFVTHIVLDPANPSQFAVLKGEGDAIVLGRRGDGTFRWPLGVESRRVRLSIEGGRLRTEALSDSHKTTLRGADSRVEKAAGVESRGRGAAPSDIGAAEKPAGVPGSLDAAGARAARERLFATLKAGVETNAVTEAAGRSAKEGPAAAADNAYSSLPPSLLRVAEGFYAETMAQATPRALARMEKTSAADPAWWSDHGPNHVRNIVENISHLLFEAQRSGLIEKRPAARSEFMDAAGRVEAALHDMWMKDLTGKGRKLHPSRAARESFSEALDGPAADFLAMKVSGGRTLSEVLVSEYGVPRAEVARVGREIMAMSYAHSKSNVPLSALNDPAALRRAMVEVTTSKDKWTSHFKAEEGTPGEALAGERQPYRRFYERGGKDAFDSIAFDWVTDNPKLAADMVDLSRSLRVADALRWRGSADFRGSQGSSIGIARLPEGPRTYMRLSDPETGLTYLVLYDSHLAMGEANIKTAQLTPKGDLHFAFESGDFGSRAGAERVAEGTAHVLMDVWKDFAGSFNGIEGRRIVLERPLRETEGFTETVRDKLLDLARQEGGRLAADLEARLADGRIAIEAGKPEPRELSSARKAAAFLEGQRYDQGKAYRPTPEALKALQKMAERSGVDTTRMDFGKAVEGARVLNIPAGEKLLARGSPSGYVYLPLGDGLAAKVGKGYTPSPIKAGAPIGELSALGRSMRNADVVALPLSELGGKRAVSVLAIPREVYLREWTKSYYEHSNILERLKKDYPPAEIGASQERLPGPLARTYGRLNVRLGQGFYRATGGSFGILPETFGKNTHGDPLIILERKTLPFSQLLPASLRPAHYLSIGVNAAPDLASKKSLIKAFADLGSPETLKRLGVGEPGGPRGFKVVTENPALVAFAKRFEKDGWKVTPYAEGTGGADRFQHWLQHPYASIRRLGETLFGIKRADPRHIIMRDFSAEPSAPRAPPASADVGAAELPPAGLLARPIPAGGSLKKVFNPLAAGEVIIDSNIAIAMERLAAGNGVQPQYEAWVKRASAYQIRLTERAFDETRLPIGNGVVAVSVPRTTPEFRALRAVLDKEAVGRKKGIFDRDILSDAFFAVTADGAPAKVMTADRGIYNPLAKLAGHDPARLPGGKTVPEFFPDGFEVTINGRTIKVLPLAGK